MGHKSQIYTAVFLFVVVLAAFTKFIVFQIGNYRNAIPESKPQRIDPNDVTGTPEFMAKWITWKNLPESKRRDWLAKPRFKWMKDYLNLVTVSDSGISSADFEKWVVHGFGYIDKENRVPITQAEVKRLQTGTVMFDCRPYVLNDELKSAIQMSQQLTWLRLSEEFTAHDFEWLADLERLKGLSLKGVPIENKDLRWLAKFDDLKWLELQFAAGNRLTLPSLPRLEVLHMTGDGVTDQQIPVSEQFPNLRSLGIDSSKVTDDGVAQIAKYCPRLVALDLGWCGGITYDCVKSLAELKALRYLYLNHTQLETHASVYAYQTIPELQIKLPQCHIRIGER